VVALACNLDFLRSRFLAKHSAKLIAGLRQTLAWEMPAFALLIGRHHSILLPKKALP
jgi:hypothetical protein